jgi:predicted transcriptional regulator
MSRPTRRRTKRTRPEPRSVNKGGYYYLYDARNLSQADQSNFRRATPTHKEPS